MKSAEHWLVHEHTVFEVLLSKFRDLVETESWDVIGVTLNDLIKSLDFHMGQEEEVLYPAYDAKTGPPYQPTSSLREDHDQIVELVREIVDSVKEKDLECTIRSFSFLEALMIKHHQIEEDIFLPMASHILFGEREALSVKLNEYKGSDNSRDWGV